MAEKRVPRAFPDSLTVRAHSLSHNSTRCIDAVTRRVTAFHTNPLTVPLLIEWEYPNNKKATGRRLVRLPLLLMNNSHFNPIVESNAMHVSYDSWL